MDEQREPSGYADSIRMTPGAEQAYLASGLNWPQPADGGVGIMTDSENTRRRVWDRDYPESRSQG